jgi:uncharacterized DUF497 family protein
MAAHDATGFDWDAGNWEKCQRHGVSIGEIEAVLLGDPRIAAAPRRSRAEDRFIAVGRTSGGRALFIAFTFRFEMGLALFGPSALVICMPGRSSGMKRRAPRLSSDEEAEAFLDSDLSDLDFSQFKSGRLRLVNSSKRTAKTENVAPSETYRSFERAMAERKQIVCVYKGHRRAVCPIILGHTQGEERALTYQFAGGSSSKLPSGGQWRCLTLANVSEVQLRDGLWYSGDSHKQPSGCVEIVDVDVNPDSPYKPKRQLASAVTAKPVRRAGKRNTGR